jgi:hypothetical protein
MSRKKDAEELTPEQQRVIGRVRKLMLVPLLVMIVGFLTVFGVIAYRLSMSGERGRPVVEKVLNLSRGARVISTSVDNNKLAVTIEVGGSTEVLLYDLETMQPAGRFVIRTTP